MTRVVRILLPAVPIAFAVLVYHSITANYFLLDDFPNLFLIEDDPAWQYLLKPHGGHILLARNFVFFITAKLFGPVPAFFFWPVLLTHLLNAWLLFRVIERFTDSPLAACFGATLWAISPAHEETLGWYSVYGHVLVGTILLVILHRAAGIARGEERFTWRVSWLWFLLALLAATCFGTGLGVAMALPFVALVLLPGVREHRRRLAPLFALLVIVPLLYLGLLSAYVLLSGKPYPTTSILASVLDRAQQTAAMLAYLIAYASSRLPFGFVDLPRSIPDATSYAVLAAFAGSLLWLVWRSPVSRRPVVACLVLLIAVYGTIAAGRAPFLEKTNAVVTQGRYHYVSFMLLGILLGLVLAGLGSWPRLPVFLKRAALGAWLALMAAAYVELGPTIDHHDDVRVEVEKVLATIRRKADASPPGQPVFIMNHYFEPVPAYFVKFEDFPGWAGVFAVFQPENTIDGKRVYFMQQVPRIRDQLKRGKRMADLIVAPRPGVDDEEVAPNPFKGVFRERALERMRGRRPPDPTAQ